MNQQQSVTQVNSAQGFLDARTRRMIEEEFEKFDSLRKSVLERVEHGRKLYEEEFAKPEQQERYDSWALQLAWKSRLDKEFPKIGKSSSSGDTSPNPFELVIDRGNPFPFAPTPSGRSRVSEYGWEEKDIAVIFNVNLKTINSKLKNIKKRWPALFQKLVLSRKIEGKRISRQYHEDIFHLILHYDEIAYLKKLMYPPANFVNGKPVPVSDDKKKQIALFWNGLKREKRKTLTPPTKTEF